VWCVIIECFGLRPVLKIAASEFSFRTFLCVCVCVWTRESEQGFNMFVTSIHGSQFTRLEAVISWCCYPESSHPPPSRFSEGSADATSSMVASRTNERPTSSPTTLLYYRFPLHSTSNRWLPALSAPFPLFSAGFASEVRATVESRCGAEGCERSQGTMCCGDCHRCQSCS